MVNCWCLAFFHPLRGKNVGSRLTFECRRVPSTSRRPFLAAAAHVKTSWSREGSIDGVCYQSKPLPTSFRHGPRRAFCAGRATLLRVVPSGAAGCRFQRRGVTCVTPPQAGKMRLSTAGSFTAALWKSSECASAFHAEAACLLESRPCGVPWGRKESLQP